MHKSLEQHIIIKFLCNENVKLTEIVAKLCQQFGENTLSRAQVLYWCQCGIKRPKSSSGNTPTEPNRKGLYKEH